MRRDDHTSFSATPAMLLWIAEERELVVVRVFVM